MLSKNEGLRRCVDAVTQFAPSGAVNTATGLAMWQENVGALLAPILEDAFRAMTEQGRNQVRDKNGVEIKEGDTVRYYDSMKMWLEGEVVDVGAALAVETPENPILLYNFATAHTDDHYIYDGTPIAELEVISSRPADVGGFGG